MLHNAQEAHYQDGPYAYVLPIQTRQNLITDICQRLFESAGRPIPDVASLICKRVQSQKRFVIRRDRILKGLAFYIVSVTNSGVSRIMLWRGGVQPLSFVLRGQFHLNYNNFVHRENMISDHMAIFKKNICKFFKYL